MDKEVKRRFIGEDKLRENLRMAWCDLAKPEHGEKVLCYDKGNFYIATYFRYRKCNGARGEYWRGEDGIVHEEVPPSHWMLLEPPQIDNEAANG